MRTHGSTRAALVLGVALTVAVGASAASTHAAQPSTARPVTEADWEPVAAALGKPGQLQPGGVYRIAMPRTDLRVTVQGVDVKAGFALGSYAAFRKTAKETMVMGDLVLLDEEVPDVMAGLIEHGFAVTALHNHLNEISPHVMYMHYSGHGNAVKLAGALREALSKSKTPLGGGAPPAGASGGGAELDQQRIESALGRTGKVNNGVLQVSVPRAEKITEHGVELLPAMGVTTVLNFQPTGEGKVAITGDFVLTGREVNPVAKALREHGIQVTALHNHALGDTPRLFYMHFWANDDAVKLARGLRSGLDLTNSKKAEAPK
jgi:uncharacterized protein DUF1259